MAQIVPITGKAALAHIAKHHRHLPKLQGALFAVGVEDRGELIGVGTAGNPPRVWQGTGRFVITRIAVKPTAKDGGHAKPYCSMLYGALCRAGKALGYREAWTYTLPHEPGTSLRAAGFVDQGLTSGGEWDRPSRHRLSAVCPQRKRRWCRILNGEPVLESANHTPRDLTKAFRAANPSAASFPGAAPLSAGDSVFDAPHALRGSRG